MTGMEQNLRVRIIHPAYKHFVSITRKQTIKRFYSRNMTTIQVSLETDHSFYLNPGQIKRTNLTVCEALTFIY